MGTIEEKRAKVQKHLKNHRARLVAAGLCRDCGLQPIAEPKKKSKRTPTLCEGCRETRRLREEKRRKGE